MQLVQMALSCSLDFQVNRLEPQLVTPAKQTPHETKMLSDIDDQEGLRFQTPLIFSYMNNPLMEDRDPIEVVREALRRALVYYYPLAGRLREGPNRKLMVDCNGEGVLFVEADADVTLEQLGDRLEPPSPFLEDFLYNVPGSDDILGNPLLLVQVTRLTCGGFVFALRINHTICDGLGLAQFLNAVAELARGDEHSAPSIPPVWERNLLNARDPPSITCTHHEYEQVVDLSDHGSDAAASPMVQRSFYFGPKEIRALKKLVPPHLSACSTFELITACLWKCRTVALEMNPKQMVCVSCVVGARGKRNNLALPLGYYGNAIAFPSAVSTVQLLCENPLGYAVELVKKATSRMSEEYIRSVADLTVIKGRPKFSIPGSFIVADTTRSGYGQVDFGWGKPIFSGVAKSVNLINMYIQLKNKEKDGTLALLCLPLSCVERFQQEFNKMTLEPVEHNYIIKHARIIMSTM